MTIVIKSVFDNIKFAQVSNMHKEKIQYLVKTRQFALVLMR